MKLADLIDRLLEIQNKYDCDSVKTSIMQEKDFGITKKKIVQIESQVKDVAVSIGKDGFKKIVIIGNEID